MSLTEFISCNMTCCIPEFLVDPDCCVLRFLCLLVLFGCDVDRETKCGEMKNGRSKGAAVLGLDVDL